MDRQRVVAGQAARALQQAMRTRFKNENIAKFMSHNL